MAKRIFAWAAVLLLVVTLTACGDTGSTKPNTNKDPDTTPNGNTSTQPDTNGTEDDVIPGNSMNGGHNTDGGAVPGDGPESARGARTVTRARVRSEAAAFDSDYQQIINELCPGLVKTRPIGIKKERLRRSFFYCVSPCIFGKLGYDIGEKI